jgi:hypothetical protein
MATCKLWGCDSLRVLTFCLETHHDHLTRHRYKPRGLRRSFALAFMFQESLPFSISPWFKRAAQIMLEETQRITYRCWAWEYLALLFRHVPHL